MAILNGTMREYLSSEYALRAVYASLHTADPGTTATTNEVTGGSPAYARVAITWSAGTAGDGITTGTAIFNVPAGTFTYAGICSGLTGTTLLDKTTIPSTTFSAQGQLTVTFTYTQS